MVRANGAVVSSILKSIEKRPALWALCLIVLPTLARIAFVASGQLNLVQDEAQYWDWTRNLQLTYYSKGPLIALIIKTWTSVFGNTELGVRFGSIIGSVMTQCVLFYCIAKYWRKPVVAAATLLIFNTMPLFVALGLLMTTDNSFVFFWTVCLFSLYQSALPRESIFHGPGQPRTVPFVVMAASFGLGILAKYTMLGFAGLAVVSALIMSVSQLLPQRYWRRLLLALTAGVIIGFLPTLIWNMQNDFVGYKHVFYLIGVKGKQAAQLIRFDRFPEYFGSQLGLALPWWLVFAFIAGVPAVRQALDFRSNRSSHNESQPDKRQAIILSVFFWPMWLFFLAWSFHAKVMPNWTTVSYVAGAILAAFTLTRYMAASRSKARKWAGGFTWASLIILTLAFSYHVLPLPDSLNITHRLKGWQELGDTVGELAETKFKDPSKVFFFSDLYDMTAELSFYVPGQKRAYCAWIDDRRMNQYDLWPGPQDRKGWDAVFVRKHHTGSHPEVARMFRKISEPMYITTTYNGRPARKFTLYLCYGYTGYWPEHPGRF